MYRCQLILPCFVSQVHLVFVGNISIIQTCLYAVFIRLHVYCHIRLILHDLDILLPQEDGFSKVKNSYIQSAYYSPCDAYSVDPTETWMYGDWFYTTDYAIFGHEVKTTERSPPDNLTRWIITQSKGFTRKSIEQISRSVRAYVYLVLTSQVQARSSIVGNSAPVVDAQQVFKGTFKALINENYSVGINIERSQACVIKGRFFSRRRHIHGSK